MITLRRLPYLAVTALAALLAAACSEAPTAPSSFSPFAQTDLRNGTGAAAASGDTVTVHYTGWLYKGDEPDQKGVEFDTSAGLDPFTFTLGAGQVIAGWEQGLPGMQAGGLRRLVVPPSLAYGASRSARIPPDATLVFEIELLEVQ